MTTCPSKTILVVPRCDGVLVSVDGVSYFKDMTAQQLLWMAERFLKHGIEAMNAKEEKDRFQQNLQKENNL